jgi:hypothetical protein
MKYVNCVRFPFLLDALEDGNLRQKHVGLDDGLNIKI